MVRAQKLLIDHLGIEQLFCVIGGSMGAMQVLQWASSYPAHVFAAVPVAGAARHSAQNIAFHEVGRQAIMADPDWCGGRYLSLGRNDLDRGQDPLVHLPFVALQLLAGDLEALDLHLQISHCKGQVPVRLFDAPDNGYRTLF
jgi:pimeloyl-ACP methyl ester carboxylesterase